MSMSVYVCCVVKCGRTIIFVHILTHPCVVDGFLSFFLSGERHPTTVTLS